MVDAVTPTEMGKGSIPSSSLVLCSYRLTLPDPYVGPDGVDFICSQPGQDGMTHCADDIPLWTENGVPCNGTSHTAAAGGPTSATSCVNWNQYYTVCKTGLSNPYRGSISFDNIGLAWVAIFQVFMHVCRQQGANACDSHVIMLYIFIIQKV